MTFHYNPDDRQTLFLQTEARCSMLEELAGRLKDHTLKLEDLKEDFDRVHQPDAVALADTWSNHLPYDDPRFIYRERVGNLRRVDLSDMRTLQAPLAQSAEIAATQLRTMASILRKLAASPAEGTKNNPPA